MNYIIIDAMKKVRSIIWCVVVIIISLALLSSSTGTDAVTWRCIGVVDEVQFVCYGETSSTCTTMSAPNSYLVCNGTKMVLIPLDNTN